ncbi:ROK family protein [Paracoccus litorisediminis]|uniref:ROK family protein n=1 Tax=Paracoccus litorisediminis TaxID=2006130 RepID=A0A844HUW3_9RHOB|nr:ROK family protein [Paracoccus litorisediminis]
MHEIVSTGSSPRRIRISNAVAALTILHSSGCMSRADLARRLGLNRSSSGQIVGELTQGGLVREVEDRTVPPPTGRMRAGRPGILLELVPDAAFFVGIEIGVEHISAVVMDLSGRVVLTRKRAFDAPSAPVEQAVAEAVDLVFAAMDPVMVARCQGIGVSAPMHIRPDGRVRLAPLIGWRDVALVEMIRAALPVPLPIIIENDANAFAIGDSYKRGPSGVILFLVMETGIGGGILIDGKLFRGGHGLAGEIGHMVLMQAGDKTLEQLIGRETLVGRYRAATGRRDVDLQNFLTGVRDREPEAVTIAEDWSRHLALALVQACRLIDPERIVLGGSISALYPLVSARVAAHMRAMQSVDFPAPQIAVDEDAEFGSAFGAACLLHQRFLSPESDVLGGTEPADHDKEIA